MGKKSTSVTGNKKDAHVAKGRPAMTKRSAIREKSAAPGIDKRMAFAILHELQKYKALRRSASFLQKDLEDLYGSAAGQVVMGELTLSASETNADKTSHVPTNNTIAKDHAMNSDEIASESDPSSSDGDSEEESDSKDLDCNLVYERNL